MSISELALAYSSFPNGGWHAAAPSLLTKIEDADGEVLYEAKTRPRVRMVDERPAYQVHDGLAQDLRTGTASAAFGKYGLKAMAAGGKPGTSYNFADALFAGYNSEVTCVVWTGFDKPSPIYRGAFGSQLAMPVWVQVMNAAAEDLPPKDIPAPKGLRKVEICAESGELATTRCFETVDGKQVRTTFFTYATPGEVPTQYCQVHSGGRSSAAAMAASRAAAELEATQSGGSAPWPKAVAAVNLQAVPKVQVKSPSVLIDAGAKDPYGAVEPAVASDAEGNATDKPPGDEKPEVGKEVRKALPVTSTEQDIAVPPVKIDPPDPLEFN